MEPELIVKCTMPSNVNYIVPIAIIISSLIGGGWLLLVNWMNMHRNSKAEFRDKFLTCIEGLYPRQLHVVKGDINDLLDSKLPAMQTAVLKYSFYLGKCKRKRFIEAWEKYKTYYTDLTKQSLTVYAFYGKGEDSPYIKFAKLVDDMLKFAE